MIVTAGKTNVSVYYYIVQDASGTSPGEPVTGLLFSDIETGGSASYTRQGAARADLTLVTLASASAAHVDGGFVKVDDVNSPGLYRCDYPDVAFTTGVDQVFLNIVVASASNAVASPLIIDIIDVDLRDTVRAGLTSLPNAQADAAGGLVISDAGGLDIDARTISSTAASNLEDMFDGTGYSDDNAPSTQVQVGNLSTGSAAISTSASSATVTVGTETLTFASTKNLDQVYHELDDVAGQIDATYHFSVGGAGVGVSATFTGRLSGANDVLDVFAYNWGTTTWDQIGTIQGANGAVDVTGSFNLDVAHTGTGANAGKVDVRGYEPSALTSATMYLDQVYVSYAVVSQSVGYAQGRVWVNTTAANTGTELYIDGVADNPVSTLAAAKTIADNLGIKDFHITSNSSLTLAQAWPNYNFFGVGYTLNTAGQDLANTHFYHASPINGTVLATGGHADFLDSIIQVMTVNEIHYTNCSFTDNTVTFGAVTGEIKIVNCRGVSAGYATFDFGVSVGIDHDLLVSNWQSGIEIRNFNNGGFDSFYLTGTGRLLIAATCSGTMYVSGAWEITDNSGGAVTIICDDVKQNVDNILVDTNELQVDWVNGGRLDTILDSRMAEASINTTGGAVDTTTAVTNRVTANTDQLAGSTTAATNLSKSAAGIEAGAAIVGTLSTTEMTTDLTEVTDDHYIGRIIIWTSGVLANQATDITDYTGVTKLLTYTATTDAPSAADTFVIV